jgi:hypothetical protein
MSTEPLTPEEERVLREDAVTGYGLDERSCDYITSLFATLDAARAAQDVAGREESDFPNLYSAIEAAAPPVTPPPDALRHPRR